MEKSELNKHEKRATIINKASAIWTLLSTAYAVVSACIFIAKGWVPGAASIALICVLVLYIIVFAVLAVMTFKDVGGGVKRVKTYKRLLKIFKAAANVVLLSISAVSMVGMGIKGLDGVSKLVAFIITLAVAVIQLGLKIVLFAMKLTKAHIARSYKVEYVSFVDGKRQRKSVAQKFKEGSYKDK